MAEAADETTWRRCSACKKPIGYGAAFWICSVSTCNRKRTALAFCSVSCWDAHLPVARHREAWAVEATAPTRAEAAPAGAARPDAPRERRRVLVRPPAAEAAAGRAADEVLIVASRLKDYVRARSGFQTSDRVLGPLSDIVRRACDEAIRNARAEGRRTVLDRDIPE
jgi:hypothetical protein